MKAGLAFGRKAGLFLGGCCVRVVSGFSILIHKYCLLQDTVEVQTKMLGCAFNQVQLLIVQINQTISQISKYTLLCSTTINHESCTQSTVFSKTNRLKRNCAFVSKENSQLHYCIFYSLNVFKGGITDLELLHLTSLETSISCPG